MKRAIIFVFSIIFWMNFVLADQSFSTDRVFQNHSWSNSSDVVVAHIDMQLQVDMDAKRIYGFEKLYYKRLTENSTHLILDAKGINIKGVYKKPGGKKLNWQSAQDFYQMGVGNAYSMGSKLLDSAGIRQFGAGIAIEIGKGKIGKGNSYESLDYVIIEWETSDASAALQWLSPEQTNDKKHSFLFSQSQAILARTWIPLQDEPKVRFTYNSVVEVAAKYNVVMSAIKGKVQMLAVDAKNKWEWKSANEVVFSRELMLRNLGYKETDDAGSGLMKISENGLILTAEARDYPLWRHQFDATGKGSFSFGKIQEEVKKLRFSFSQSLPIPSYLMAIAVGVFRYHSYKQEDDKQILLRNKDSKYADVARNSKETGIYAEQGMLDKVVKEFSALPKMLVAAEKIYGQYVWGAYRVLFLPPSFPFGGMENPVVTFATPTIIAGDGSLQSLLAHELAHSWSGNLVTNASWNDFWLNEGFTNYFESRIMESLYGKPYADMLVNLAYADLVRSVEVMMEDSQGRLDTRLRLDLSGRDPDEGVTDIAYEKGRFLLLLLERLMGRIQFDEFLKWHFGSHAFSSITTDDFLKELKYFLAIRMPEQDEKLMCSAYQALGLDRKARAEKFVALLEEKWIDQPGLQPEGNGLFDLPFTESNELVRVDADMQYFWAHLKSPMPKMAVAVSQMDVLSWKNEMGKKAVKELNPTGYTAHHWVHFLRRLRATGNLELNVMKALDDKFGLTNTQNSEIAFEWFMLSIHNHYGDAINNMQKFLLEVGRRKFVMPIYEFLAQQGEIAWVNSNGLIYRTDAKMMAKEIFLQAEPGYHSVTAHSIREILGLQSK